MNPIQGRALDLPKTVVMSGISHSQHTFSWPLLDSNPRPAFSDISVSSVHPLGATVNHLSFGLSPAFQPTRDRSRHTYAASSTHHVHTPISVSSAHGPARHPSASTHRPCCVTHGPCLVELGRISR